MRRIGICVLAILLSQTISASSTPCEEGIRILNSTDTRELSPQVRQIIQRARAAARRELERGNEEGCKLYVADAIRRLMVEDADN